MKELGVTILCPVEITIRFTFQHNQRLFIWYLVIKMAINYLGSYQSD